MLQLSNVERLPYGSRSPGGSIDLRVSYYNLSTVPFTSAWDHKAKKTSNAPEITLEFHPTTYAASPYRGVAREQVACLSS